jgi:hypothetical protein
MSSYFPIGDGSTSFLIPFLLGLFALSIAACDSGGGGPAPQEDETIVSDETVVVDSSDASLEQIRGDTLAFSLSGSAPDFESGDIVVGAESGGFLRRVTSVETAGDQATLLTQQASMVEAVESGELSKSFDLSGSQRNTQAQPKRNGWKAVRTVEGVEPKANGLGIELSDAVISENDESGIEIAFSNGEANFDPTVDFDIEIRGNNIEELRIAASGTAEFSTDVEVTATNTLSKGNSKSLATFRKPPVVFFIGPVPVTIQPTLDFVAGYEAAVEQTGSVQVGFQSSETVTLGAEYIEGGWNPISEREKSLSSDMFDWGTELTAEAKGYVRPELTFKLYQVAGPFINTGPYVLTDAVVNTESWYWNINGGLDASFGGKLEVFSLELDRYEHTFSLAESEIASDSGSVSNGRTVLSGDAITPEGAPLSDMSVMLFGENQNYSVTTDEAGEFSQEVEPGTYEIEGHAVKETTYFNVSPRQTDVMVEEGQMSSVTLDTEEGYYLDLRNATLGGEEGTVSASPGESLDLEFDYTSWSRSENSGSIIYAAAGIGRNGQEAADLDIPGNSPGEDGNASLTLTAPSETGTYTVHVFNAPNTSEGAALNRYEDAFPDEDQFITAATLEVGSGSGGSDNTYAPGNGYEYFVTQTEYNSDTDDIPSLIEQEFGVDASMADWNTLKDLYHDSESGLVEFLDEIGVKEDDSVHLRREGERYWSGDRHYFVKRHNGDIEGSFLVHDDLHSNTLSLGSWWGTKPALVRIHE